jgi:transposase InsO family protein
VDTTVVETNISYPTDSGLLADGVRVLTRGLKRIERMTGVVGQKVRNRKRATIHRVLAISRAARSRNLKDSRARLQAGYRRLLGLVRAKANRCRSPAGLLKVGSWNGTGFGRIVRSQSCERWT